MKEYDTGSVEGIAPRNQARMPWTPPAIVELPKLTELTLLTGEAVPGDGSTGGGGSTVF